MWSRRSTSILSTGFSSSGQSDPKQILLLRHQALPKEIKLARTCYDHLTGQLGVSIVHALLQKQYLEQEAHQFCVTPLGEKFFHELSIDTIALSKLRRAFARSCLDWTEREYHLAGSLGKAIFDYFVNHRLIIQAKKPSRVIMLTTKGKQWLFAKLAINLQQK